MATITSFNFNASLRQVVITFDTTITAINQLQFFAVNSNTSTSTQYPLAGTVTGLNSTTVTIALNDASFYAIQSTWVVPSTSNNVWDSSARCYIYVNNSTATTPAFTGLPFYTQVTTYTSPPPFFFLTSFSGYINKSASSNLVNYNLECNFTFAMSATVNFTSITISNNASSPTFSYTLTGGTAFAANNKVYIKFNDADWAAFKAESSVFNSPSDTFISFTSSAFQNVSGAAVDPVSPSFPVSASIIDLGTVAGYQVNVNNEFIYGGSADQSLTTNGSGALRFASPVRSKAPNFIFGPVDGYQFYETFNGIDWTYAPQSAVSDSCYVLYGRNNYVAVASQNQYVGTSTDGGITWTQNILSALPSSGFFPTLTNKNGQFVIAVQGAATAIVSNDDGITWATGSSLPSSANWINGSYGNGTYLIYASGSTSAAISSNGLLSWTSVTLPSIGTNTWNWSAYGNGLFVVVQKQGSSGGTDAYATSPDGSNWTLRTLPATAYWSGLVFDGNRFILCSGTTNGTQNSATIYTSSDGITWLLSTIDADIRNNYNSSGIAVNANQILFMNGNGIMYSSTDGGITFTQTADVASQGIGILFTNTFAGGYGYGNVNLISPSTGINSSLSGSNLTISSSTSSYNSVATIKVGDIFSGISGPSGTLSAPTDPMFGQSYLADGSITYDLRGIKFFRKNLPLNCAIKSLNGSVSGAPLFSAIGYSPAVGTLPAMWMALGYSPSAATQTNGNLSVFTSLDGVNFTQVDVSGTNVTNAYYKMVKPVRTGANTRNWIAIPGNDGTARSILYSTNEGVSWTISTATSTDPIVDAMVSNISSTQDRISIVYSSATPSAQVQTSSNGGTSFSFVTPTGVNPSQYATSIAYNLTGSAGSQVGVIGIFNTSTILRSTDSGASWVGTNVSGSLVSLGGIFNVTYNTALSKFVAIGQAGNATSTDGLTWTISTLSVFPTYSNLYLMNAASLVSAAEYAQIFKTNLDVAAIGVENPTTPGIPNPYSGLTIYSEGNSGVAYRERFMFGDTTFRNNTGTNAYPSYLNGSAYNNDLVVIIDRQSLNIAVRSNTIWIDAGNSFQKAPIGTYKCLGPTSSGAGANTYLWLRTA